MGRRYIQVSGVLGGLKIPVAYRGQWVVFEGGRLCAHDSSFEEALTKYEKRRIREDLSPLVLRVPTWQEEKRINVYLAA